MSRIRPPGKSTLLLTTVVGGAEGRIACGGKGRRRRNRAFVSLAKVVAGRRYLHSAERLRTLTIFRPEAIATDASILLLRLSEEQTAHAKGLAAEIKENLSAVTGLGKGGKAQNQVDRSSSDDLLKGVAILLAEARRVVNDSEDIRLERAAEGQRRVVWLTYVGLLLILAFGVVGRREILLFGALGGVLAPLTTVWQRGDDLDSKKRVRADGGAEYVASWGALLLGPVAGALAAYGGLLLISFLSNDKLNVLGEVFRDNSWNEPIGSFGMALALLFGFSGGLFGKLALRAAAEVLPPTSVAAASRDKELQSEADGAGRPSPSGGGGTAQTGPKSYPQHEPDGGAEKDATPDSSPNGQGKGAPSHAVMDWISTNAGTILSVLDHLEQERTRRNGGDEPGSTSGAASAPIKAATEESRSGAEKEADGGTD